MTTTDTRTGLEHLIADASVIEHRRAGRYLAVCGIEVLAASLAERVRGQCEPCREQAAP